MMHKYSQSIRMLIVLGGLLLAFLALSVLTGSTISFKVQANGKRNERPYFALMYRSQMSSITTDGAETGVGVEVAVGIGDAGGTTGADRM